jgi:hypothetical protein
MALAILLPFLMKIKFTMFFAALQSVAQALCPRFTAFTHCKISKNRKAIFNSPN